MVHEDCAGSAVPEDHIQRLKGLIDRISSERLARGFTFRQFSDSFVVAMRLGQVDATDLIGYCSDLQWRFLADGFLIRGAICSGKHYDDDRLLYSEGLVKAYHMERDHARFPRIILDEALLVWLRTGDRWDEIGQRIASLCVQDRDGRVFVDYLSERPIEDLRLHARVGQELYEAARDKSIVLPKFEWLARYHEYCCANEVDLPRIILRGFTGLQTQFGIKKVSSET